MMFDFIYVEDEVRAAPRAAAIIARHPQAEVVSCGRYSELFNRAGQNFRLQKQRPALILASKHGRRVLPAPEGFGIGGKRNFYFSHMLNCVYDCRYCFLQGMYRSAHMVVFVNFEDFRDDIDATLARYEPEPLAPKAVTRPVEAPYFFTGYDCDSLAMESVTGFAGDFLPYFASRTSAFFELRTKSVRTSALLRHEPLDNVVVAYSLAPSAIAGRYEHGVPPVHRRIDAIRRLQAEGWPVGLRFDPVVRSEGWRTHYRDLFHETFSAVRADAVHSVSIGALRLPRTFHRRMETLYPEEPLFAAALRENAGVVSYAADAQRELLDFCMEELTRYVPEFAIFPCGSQLATGRGGESTNLEPSSSVKPGVP